MSDHSLPELVAAAVVALTVGRLAFALLARPVFAALLLVTVVVPALTVALSTVAVRSVGTLEAHLPRLVPDRVCIPATGVCLRVESCDAAC